MDVQGSNFFVPASCLTRPSLLPDRLHELHQNKIAEEPNFGARRSRLCHCHTAHLCCSICFRKNFRELRSSCRARSRASYSSPAFLSVRLFAASYFCPASWTLVM